METFFLPVCANETVQGLHEKLKALFHFPAYYGCNLDALNDCLSERKEKGRLWIHGAKTAPENIQSLLNGVEQVFKDNGYSVLWLD
jgi:Barstar, RNAse (barnase) inhibitor